MAACRTQDRPRAQQVAVHDGVRAHLRRAARRVNHWEATGKVAGDAPVNGQRLVRRQLYGQLQGGILCASRGARASSLARLERLGKAQLRDGGHNLSRAAAAGEPAAGQRAQGTAQHGGRVRGRRGAFCVCRTKAGCDRLCERPSNSCAARSAAHICHPDSVQTPLLRRCVMRGFGELPSHLYCKYTAAFLPRHHPSGHPCITPDARLRRPSCAPVSRRPARPAQAAPPMLPPPRAIPLASTRSVPWRMCAHPAAR